MCGSLAIHNPFENRNLVRNLYLTRDIEGDAEFQFLMTMTNEEYARGLAHTYGRMAA